MTIETSRSVPDLGRALQEILSKVKATSIEQIQSSSGALSAFDDRADIEIIAQGQSLLGPQWAVQVYVVDEEDKRAILLVALGEGGFTRAMSGARNSLSLSASIKRRDEIAAALR
ncbi:hypothetical protein AB2L57_09395 [Microbacterium sp. HA-8]|uniref:hypothetical protein n=1 Tax=Microbacterium sp. HA-8 TaxID=3234200 RepID=UPI0038F6B11B